MTQKAFFWRSVLTVAVLLMSAWGQAQITLSTYPTIQQNNGSGGISFEVTPSVPVILTEIANAFSSGGQTVDIWYRPGGVQHIVGQGPTVSTANGWIQLATGIAVTGNGTSPVSIPFALNLPLQPGQTYGFFLEGSTQYTTWTSTNQDRFTDGFMEIFTGTNAGYGGNGPSPINHPRQFVGSVTYRLLSNANDAGINALIEPQNFCSGTQPVSVSIQNYGINQINGLTINWEVDGAAQPPVSYNGLLDTFNGTGRNIDTVSLGTLAFTSNQVRTIKAWTSNPNGLQDTSNTNDTIEVVVRPSLSGTFTIGGANPDFNTFADAVTALQFGICGPVTFRVRPGTYNEQVKLSNIGGASLANPITFESTVQDSSAVNLVGTASSSDNYTLLVDGTSFVTFRNITLGTTGGTYAKVIDLTSQSSDISFLNCRIMGDTTGATTSTLKSMVSTSTTSAENNLTFMNCYMRGGSYGFYNYGAATQKEENLVIENCDILSYYRGIQISNPQGTTIRNNRIISNTFANYTSFAGIYVLSGVEMGEISGNYINSAAGNYGMYFSATTNTLPTLVANNMVHVGGGTAAVYGIYFTGTCANFDLYHNTIHVTAPNTNGRTLQAASANTVGISVINNVMANTGGGFTYYFTTTTSGAVDVASHNCLYSTGSVLAYWNSTNQATLTDLQAASGRDQNSLSVDPGFFSATNLHATAGAMNDKGLPLPGITADIDGEFRNPVTPDIGADEYDPIANDLAMLGFVSPNQLGCDAFDSTIVTVMILNNGTAPQTGFKVAFQIFAIQVANESVTTTVLPGDTLFYTFNKKVLINVPAIYSFKTWLNPADQNPANDTISNHFVYVDRGVSTFPYLQNFNIDQGTTLTGWLNDPFDNNEEWVFGENADGISGDVQGTGFFAYVDNASPNSDPINYLTPCFDLGSMARPTLEFQHYLANASIALHIDLLVDGEWIENIINPLSAATGGWTFNRADLTPYAGKIVKVRFRAREIGTTTVGDLGLDDVKVYDLPPINTGVIAAAQPLSGCGLSDIETVEIQFIHTGYDTLRPGDIVPVGFRVNNGPSFAEQAVITKVVPPLDTFAYEFFNVADLGVPGDYTIRAWTDYPTDNDVTNDTLTTIITHIPNITTYPYFQDFESGSGGWLAEGTLSTWGLGKPAGVVINQSIKGDNAWVTNLTGLYNNSENSFVGGPCFDFSTVLNPQIALDVWWDAENSYDGAAILYSIDGGVTWSLLGSQGEGINWYNDNTINGAPGGQQVGWTGTGTTGSQFWRSAKLNMPLLAGQPSVLFRVHFGAETSVQDDGFAFDNIAIGDAPILSIPDTIYGCGEVVIDGGVPGLSYIWSTGQTTRFARVSGGVDTVVTRVTVYAENQYGLYAADTAIVVVAPGPVVDLGEDGLYCDVSPLVLDAGNSGSVFRWDNGSTDQTRPVTANGTYYVEVTRAGCAKTDTITVQLEESPVAGFTLAKDPQNPSVVTFTNTSQNGTSYEWQFGNGYFSNQFEPIHFYPGSGTFQVMLIVTNACGSDTIQQSISVFPVGIGSPVETSLVTLSPNPATQTVVLTAAGVWMEQAVQVEIIDLQGRVVWWQQWNAGTADQLPVSLDNWAAGLYQVRIIGDDTMLVLPFVKQ